MVAPQVGTHSHLVPPRRYRRQGPVEVRILSSKPSSSDGRCSRLFCRLLGQARGSPRNKCSSKQPEHRVLKELPSTLVFHGSALITSKKHRTRAPRYLASQLGDPARLTSLGASTKRASVAISPASFSPKHPYCLGLRLGTVASLECLSAVGCPLPLLNRARSVWRYGCSSDHAQWLNGLL